MLLSIALVLIAFLWLMIETKDLSVNLCGKVKPKTLLLSAGYKPTILALPASTFTATTFEPCDLESESIESNTILNVGAKIL